MGGSLGDAQDARSEGIPHTVAQARVLAERLRELVDSKEAQAGEIVVLLRAFTHLDAYEEALRTLRPGPYVVGGRGYWSQQQVEDLLRLLGWSQIPSTTSRPSAHSPAPRRGFTRRAVAAAQPATGKGAHLWPVVEFAFGTRMASSPPSLSGSGKVPEEDSARLRRFCERLRALAPNRPSCLWTSWSSGR